MADLLYFILRYIPWWAVPACAISFQFANIYFAKEMRKLAWFFTFSCVVSFFSLIWYIYAGSPRNSVWPIQKLLESL